MKILHLIKKDLSPTERAIVDAHRAAHDTTVIDLRTDRDYAAIVTRIFAADRVISW
ncbi:MAG TPA: hypothetical protein VI078_03565 [bacterium]